MNKKVIPLTSTLQLLQASEGSFLAVMRNEIAESSFFVNDEGKMIGESGFLEASLSEKIAAKLQPPKQLSVHVIESCKRIFALACVQGKFN